MHSRGNRLPGEFVRVQPDMPHRKRSQARMLALQAACLYDALDKHFDAQVDEFLTDTINHHDLNLAPPEPRSLSFARALATEVWRRQKDYDAILNASVSGWSVQRMPPVDRNVLRMGLHELLECPETPHQVVINEAIELARMFGDVDSPAFVNGVLDAIRRQRGLADEPAATTDVTPVD